MKGKHDPNFFEEFLAPEKDWATFVCTRTSTVRQRNTPVGNRYVFVRANPVIVKDRRDIEFFRSLRDGQFVEVKKDQEIKVTKKAAVYENPTDPIPTPQIKVEVVDKSKETLAKEKADKVAKEKADKAADKAAAKK